jgi:hypothetical protein
MVLSLLDVLDILPRDAQFALESTQWRICVIGPVAPCRSSEAVLATCVKQRTPRWLLLLPFSLHKYSGTSADTL